MVNLKGLASYCQECGACASQAGIGPGTVAGLDGHVVDQIVEEVMRTLGKGPRDSCGENNGKPLIPLGVSNRHIHLTAETLVTLFGKGAVLEKYRQLYQPDDFAAKQTVTIVGSKMRSIQNVRILGPLRKYDQVELSTTDSVFLGIAAPVRDSGNLDGAAPLTLVGPAGSVYLPHCAIVASRHIHMPGKDAENLGVRAGDLCSVRLRGSKPTIFENVLVRVNDSWKLQLHLDTDEANATGSLCGSNAEFLGKS